MRPADLVTLGALWLAQLLILYPYFEVAPIYDGAWNYHDLMQASCSRFRCADLVLSGHTSLYYVALLLAVLKLDPASIKLVVLTNWVLLAAASLAFLSAAYHLVGHERTVEVRLATLVFGLSPWMLAHVLHLNWDFGVAIHFVILLSALLGNRPWLAAAAGLAMGLCKENGLALYLVTLLADGLRGGQHHRGRWWPHLLALLVWGALVWVAFGVQRAPVSYHLALAGMGRPQGFLSRIFAFNLLDWTLLTYLADIFVLNFHWLLSLPVLISLRFSVGSSRVLFLRVLMVGVVYLVTRFLVFNNVRYLMTALPVLLLLSCQATCRLWPKGRLGSGYWLLVLVVVTASNFRTLDPLSRALYGTFEFGQHRCLRMGRLGGSSAIGRDELVYNLEFLQLAILQDLALRKVRAQPGTLIYVEPDSDFWTPGWLDGKSRRTGRRGPRPQVFPFRYLTDPALATVARGPLCYLEFPNQVGHRVRADLLRRYGPAAVENIDHQGYRLRLYRFTGG